MSCQLFRMRYLGLLRPDSTPRTSSPQVWDGWDGRELRAVAPPPLARLHWTGTPKTYLKFKLFFSRPCLSSFFIKELKFKL